MVTGRVRDLDRINHGVLALRTLASQPAAHYKVM